MRWAGSTRRARAAGGAIAAVLALGAAGPAQAASEPPAAVPSPPLRPLAAFGTTVAPPRACIDPVATDAWPIERKVAQLVMVGVPVGRTAYAQRIVAGLGVGGILVRGTPTAAAGPGLRAIAAAGGAVPAFVAVDEEGGRVQHLREAVGALPSARAMAARMTPAEVRSTARRHGAAMAALGFNVNFAPVLDLTPVGNRTNGIGDRSFSADPVVAATYGQAFAAGIADAGLIPVVKHFPGHGRANGDSHQIGAAVPTLDQLRSYDLLPFDTVLGAAPVAVMVGHVYVGGAERIPASLSPAVIQTVLRAEMGHRGLVFTDSLSMRPVRYHFPPGEAARLALYAGNDVLLFDDEPGVAEIITAVVAAVPRDPWLRHRLQESLTRVLRAKGVLCDAPTLAPSAP